MQTQAIFNLVYAVAFFSYLLLSAFIVFHIVKYSVGKVARNISVSVFLIGTGLLLFANAVLFFSVPAESFSPKLNTGAIAPYSAHNPF